MDKFLSKPTESLPQRQICQSQSHITSSSKMTKGKALKDRQPAKHPSTLRASSPSMSPELIEPTDISPPNLSPLNSTLSSPSSAPDHAASAIWQEIGCIACLHKFGVGTDHNERAKKCGSEDQNGGLWIFCYKYGQRPITKMRKSYREIHFKIWRTVKGRTIYFVLEFQWRLSVITSFSSWLWMFLQLFIWISHQISWWLAS